MKKATTLAVALCMAGLAGIAWAQTGDTNRGQTGDTNRGQTGDQNRGQTGDQNRDQGQAQPQQGTLNKQDTDFFTDAAQGGLLEVKLGQIAVKQAQSEDVRKFAQRMVDDHTKLNGQLAQIVKQKKGIVMPQALDKKYQDEVDKLAKETTDKFDRDYMKRMVDDHQNDVKAFEKESKDGKDPDMKALANSALPTLHDHLAQAQQIESRMKK
jgi:putative membrane protein